MVLIGSWVFVYTDCRKYKIWYREHDTRGGVVRRGIKGQRKGLTNGNDSDIIAKHVAGGRPPDMQKHLEN